MSRQSVSETVRGEIDRLIAEGDTGYSIADRCSVARPTIYRWINGSRSISVETLDRLCDGLGLVICREDEVEN